MDLRLRGHAAIVQGASRGLGRAIAHALAAEGCDLLLSARNIEPLAEAAREISASTGARVQPVACDSAAPDAAPFLVGAAREFFGRLDVIVCNSGGPPAGGIRDLTDAQWAHASELVVLGPVRLVREALPLLAQSPAPRVLIVTSSSTRQPVAGLTLSNTFRPAVVGLVKTLAEELAPERVRVHSLAPGRFDTDRLRHLFGVQAEKAGTTPEAIRKGMVRSIPAGRLGEPAELANLAAFLASPLADYMTGGNWLVDGGLVRCI